MKKQIYDEKNGLSYTLHGDYYLPDLEINEEERIKLCQKIKGLRLSPAQAWESDAASP